MSTEIILRRVELRLARAHRAAHGTVTSRPTLIVEFRAEMNGKMVSGWGECPALPEPGYSHEYSSGAQAMLANVLIPAVVAGGSLEPDAVEAATSVGRGHPMARSALALASEDLAARIDGQTVAERWGAARESVAAGAAISAARPSSSDPTQALADLSTRAITLANAGYQRLKLKIEPGWDVVPAESVLASLRDSGNSSVEAAVDVNGSYLPDDSSHSEALRRLDRLGLAWIEQPYPADSIIELTRLADQLSTPICLDESATSRGQLKAFHALGMRPVVCIKAARLGGPAGARQMLDWCRYHQLDAYVGGMLSSGIGRAADRALAALPGANRVGDIGADDQYFDTDLTSPVQLAEGMAPVIARPDEPGLGATVNAEALANLTGDIFRWSIQ